MPSRETRTSIVFAGPTSDALVQSMEQPSCAVRTLYDAIGKLATCDATTLVEAVVIDDTLLEKNGEQHIDAIRRVDPTSIIVVRGSHAKNTGADASVPYDCNERILTSAIANALSKPIDANQNEETEQDLDEILGLVDAVDYVQETTNLGDTDLVVHWF